MNATNTSIASKLDPKAVWPMPGADFDTADHRICSGPLAFGVFANPAKAARALAEACGATVDDDSFDAAEAALSAEAPTLSPELTVETPWGPATGSFDDNGTFTGTLRKPAAPDLGDVFARYCTPAVPPLARNEMGPANAEEPSTDAINAEQPTPSGETDSDDLDAELKAIEESLRACQAGEPVALIAEMSEGSVQGEGADDEAEALEVLDAAAEPEADDSESAPAVKKRVHVRPTVDRLFADFTRPGRLSEAQLSAMRARCATLPGFRAAVHEFVAASVLRRPAFAHLYRYPHPRTLEQMHREWLRLNAPRVGDVAGLSVYDELSAVAVSVPL